MTVNALRKENNEIYKDLQKAAERINDLSRKNQILETSARGEFTNERERDLIRQRDDAQR